MRAHGPRSRVVEVQVLGMTTAPRRPRVRVRLTLECGHQVERLGGSDVTEARYADLYPLRHDGHRYAGIPGQASCEVCFPRRERPVDVIWSQEAAPMVFGLMAARGGGT